MFTKLLAGNIRITVYPKYWIDIGGEYLQCLRTKGKSLQSPTNILL